MSLQLKRLKAQVTGSAFVDSDAIRRANNQKFIIVIEGACLELVHTGHGQHELLDGAKHRKILEKNGRVVDPERQNPELVYSCVYALLESPLNKSGRLLIYIRTLENHLIEINPQLEIPKTYNEFQSLFGTLLLRRYVKGKKVPITLMRMINNDLVTALPPGCVALGMNHTNNPEGGDKTFEQWLCEITELQTTPLEDAIAISGVSTTESLYDPPVALVLGLSTEYKSDKGISFVGYCSQPKELAFDVLLSNICHHVETQWTLI
eukprot:Blabericola_migrator_1__7636@NODE_38_length_17790_cov_195_231733_g34_i0_p7_GENE_NODE_38_length_17790_cov_195_231733_g34_i0NODE_38_length_17790_cov_195_231733_g34_i0_p7_ORF_typecomplete_len264_score59_99EMG1/PF03587_14/1e33_NODE_38_length_17790_cov_195_231733_g34_i01662917420